MFRNYYMSQNNHNTDTYGDSSQLKNFRRATPRDERRVMNESYTDWLGLVRTRCAAVIIARVLLTHTSLGCYSSSATSRSRDRQGTLPEVVEWYDVRAHESVNKQTRMQLCVEFCRCGFCAAERTTLQCGVCSLCLLAGKTIETATRTRN